MGGDSLTASVGLAVAAVLWAALVRSRAHRLVHAAGEVVALRPAKAGRWRRRLLPTVRFLSEGDYHEVEIPEPGDPRVLRVGHDVEVLHPPGLPGRASFSGRPYRGPLLLLVIALILALAAI